MAGRTEKSSFEVNNMLTNKPKTKILVDGGDPNETLRIKSLIGFVDGQTTNPSLIAKNPEIRRLVASGYSMTSEEEKTNTRKLCKAFHHWWEMLGFPSKCLPILIRQPRTCFPRVKKCSLGFQMPMSNIPVRTRVCEPRRCRSRRVFGLT